MQRFRVTTIQLEDRHHLITICSRVALITQTLLRPGKGGRKARTKAAYFGFADFDAAQIFARGIAADYPGCRIQVRKAQRLSTAFEVKFAHESAEALAWKVAQSEPTTSQRIERHLQAVANRPPVSRDWPVARRGARKVMVTSCGHAIGVGD